MGTFVLDASVAISWCFPGDPSEDTPYSRHILSRLRADDAVVPEIWAFEIANSIFVSFILRKRITEQQVQEYLERLKALPIHVEHRDLWENVELQAQSRKLNLAAYDVAYIELALRKNLAIATVDGNLKAAALAEGASLL